MPLGNYVILEDGVPERLHFVSHTLETRTITDPKTLQPAARNVALFQVDRVNGQLLIMNGVPYTAILSVMAEGLYGKLEAYLPGNVYRDYEFIITKRGIGYTTKYTVEVIPLSTR